jgi:hypothetical protein
MPARFADLADGRRSQMEDVRVAGPAFERVALADEFPDFLTLPAYELID